MASQSSMEEGNNEVKLHGMWASPFSKRVELALKVKGIPYEYIEEDLSKKSELLLQNNPVHKKIPVLVHNGRPIAESLIILQYIDECWTNVPRLLPQDPYERARINFWVNFIHQQLFDNLRSVIKHKGEEQEKAAKEFSDKLSVMEEGIKDLYSSCTNPCFDGNTPVLLSIMLVIVLGPHEVIEEVTGVKIIDPQKNPLIFSWVSALSDLPLVKSLSSPRDKVVALLKYIRQTPM